MKQKIHVLTLLTLICSFTITKAQVPQVERDALLALYNSTDGANWNDNANWNTTNPVSTWFGVTIENIAGTDHVTELELSFNNLTGPIPPEIGDLEQLKHLSFWSNELTGTIPVEIANCINLELLSLEANNLTGTIPVELSSLINLESFWLNENNLTGDVTDIYASFPNLIYLGLYANPELTGNVNLSNNSNLKGFFGYITSITAVDVRNENNSNITQFQTFDTPTLTCIYVDDVNEPVLDTWVIDPNSTFVETETECDALSITENQLANAISIYPNPASETLTIQADLLLEINDIKVRSVTGQLLQYPKEKRKLKISSLASGIYFLNIITSKGIITKKFIKE